ncbi:Putative TrmH family tRNA/rRNA methyltransferase [Planctopirus ephydatiae]|uniref:TrmH family tRNA/rRNA methyltransferase n=2 Tax=Planctopirus ephydatiae TaxID=2528019 RepID=A0A518GU39_9PLAN|nr:Putative TrmH family tRNA/rRNA methyltransferase [Planctopirus ephydatiae]
MARQQRPLKAFTPELSLAILSEVAPMPLIPVSDLLDKNLNVYRDVKAQNAMRHGKYFIVEGVRTVERLLASKFETASILVTQEKVAAWAGLIPPEIPVYIMPTEMASQLIGFHLHVGVMACGLRRRTASLEQLLGLPDPPKDQRLATTISAEKYHERTAVPKPLLVVCPNCDNPENLGAIIRIASAFRATGLLLGNACCDPFSRRVIRVSMGNIFGLTIRESRHLGHDLQRLKTEFGFETMGAVLSDSAVSLKNVQRPHRLALLLGNEAEGLTTEWIDQCDHLVTIPMPPDVDSLNVSVAAGIFLYQLTD